MEVDAKLVRLGVVGAGMIGRRHIDTILACSDITELVGIADPDSDAGKLLGIDVPFFRTHLELLNKAKPDAVVIATPNSLHAQQGIDCCTHGVHFIVEKPVADSVESAVDLLRAIRLSGVKTLVGHHRRYLPMVRSARQILADGHIGRLVAVSAIWATRKTNEYFQVPWRKEFGGGPVLINGIHEIDLLRYLCGEIASLTGYTSSAVRNFPVEDASGALLNFQNGCIGTLICADSGLSPWTMEQGTRENTMFPYAGENSHRYIGTEGSLELPVLRLWSARNPRLIGWDKPLAVMPIEYVDCNPFVEQLKHFCRMIRVEESPVASAEEGARTLVATLAITRSARLGAPVDLTSTFRLLTN